MTDFRIPPPHTPIPLSSHQVESSAYHQKTVRLEEFELIRIKIEQFIIMASNDPKVHENVFIQIFNLEELMKSGILNADQENILIDEMNRFDFELNSGNMKVKNIFETISNFNSHLEERFPKIKAFNLIQDMKNNLCISPLDELAPMDIEEFSHLEKDLRQFLKGDIENFRINKLYNLLKTTYENFLYHPRRAYTETINQIAKITEDIRRGLI
jgi:hypothetical protein